MAFRLIALLLLLLPFSALTQTLRLSGKINDTQGKPLPFATVYPEQTTQGTTANAEGEYFLNLKPGTYRMVYRYIGFQTYTQTVTLTNQPVTVDVQLNQESLQLAEVTVRSKGKYEDPAYPIIRNAIAKRKFYLEATSTFACDAYVKGMVRLLQAPKKIMGQDVVIPGVDTSGKGILYLSESVSKFYFQRPKTKELLVSSKVSGSNNGFSLNNAVSMNQWNFYENLLNPELNERGFVSPISQNAMLFYEYKLMGTSTENGQTVHKIEVIPKRKTDPVFRGFIYIQEKSWRIHATGLLLTRDAGIDALDTLSIHQIHIPVTQDVWMPGTMEFNYSFNVFGFKANGYFMGSLTGYQLNLPFEKGFFTGEILKVESGSNKKDSAYWQQVRPVPLTVEEMTDYTRKDSLSKVWESKEYKDSVDAKTNKFKFLNVLTGYTYRNSYRNWSISLGSLLNNVQYNTVEGVVLNTDVTYNRRNEETRKTFSITNSLRYGFSGRQLYAKSGIRHLYNPTQSGSIQINGGRYISQFNHLDPVPYLVNTAYTLLAKRNYLKLYEKRFAEITWRQEILNGLSTGAVLEFARRLPLENTTNFTFRDIKEREFTVNNRLPYQQDSVSMPAHNALVLRLGLRFTFRQKYISRPNLKINLESPYPTLYVQYRKGIPNVLGSEADFDFLRVGLDKDLRMGLVGESRFDISYGTFLRKKQVYFPDFRHFTGNQTIVANNQLDAFYLLDYYRFSTVSDYWEGHYEHHFNGFIFNKIPLFKRLRWQEVVGMHYLRTPFLGNYLELTAGIDQIVKVGKVLRVGRVDFAAAFNEGRRVRTGIVFRIGF